MGITTIKGGDRVNLSNEFLMREEERRAQMVRDRPGGDIAGRREAGDCGDNGEQADKV